MQSMVCFRETMTPFSCLIDFSRKLLRTAKRYAAIVLYVDYRASLIKFATSSSVELLQDVSWTPDGQELVESDAEWPPAEEAV